MTEHLCGGSQDHVAPGIELGLSGSAASIITQSAISLALAPASVETTIIHPLHKWVVRCLFCCTWLISPDIISMLSQMTDVHSWCGWPWWVDPFALIIISWQPFQWVPSLGYCGWSMSHPYDGLIYVTVLAEVTLVGENSYKGRPLCNLCIRHALYYLLMSLKQLSCWAFFCLVIGRPT